MLRLFARGLTYKSIELRLNNGCHKINPSGPFWNFLFYLILTISYLRACSIVQHWNVIITQRFRVPVQVNWDFFFWYTDCIFLLTVNNFFYFGASYLDASSRFRLLGEIPAGAITTVAFGGFIGSPRDIFGFDSCSFLIIPVTLLRSAPLLPAPVPK